MSDEFVVILCLLWFGAGILVAKVFGLNRLEEDSDA